jgi:hypothetical protein
MAEAARFSGGDETDSEQAAGNNAVTGAASRVF